MNRTRSIIAVASVALSAAALSATEASARVPDDPGPAGAPAPATIVEVPVDDNVAEALQAGASALGGAGIAFGGLWLYRRRQLLAS